MQTIHGIYRVCWIGGNSLYVGGLGIHRIVGFGLEKPLLGPLVAGFNVGPFTAIFVGGFWDVASKYWTTLSWDNLACISCKNHWAYLRTIPVLWGLPWDVVLGFGAMVLDSKWVIVQALSWFCLAGLFWIVCCACSWGLCTYFCPCFGNQIDVVPL